MHLCGACGSSLPRTAIAGTPEPDWTKNLIGFCFLFPACPGWSSEQRQSLSPSGGFRGGMRAGLLPVCPLRKPSCAGAKRQAPACVVSPDEIQMEAAGWAPAAGNCKYLRKQLFDRMQQNIGMCRSACIAAPATSGAIRRGLPIVCGRRLPAHRSAIRSVHPPACSGVICLAAACTHGMAARWFAR